MLTLYYEANCPFALRVRIVLAEKQLPFCRRIVSGGDEPSELFELSGGSLPILADDSFAIADSTVIVEYVEDAFGRPALRPSEARGRAAMRSAMRRIDRDLTGPIDRAARLPPAERRPSVVRALLALEAWDHKLGDNGLLLGMEFSLVDAWLLAAIEEAAALGASAPAHLANVHPWWRRMLARPSVRAERLAVE